MTQPRWRAPREDGALLVAPAWEELLGLVERNQRLIEQSPLRMAGHSLLDFRGQVAGELNDQAAQYAAEMGLQTPVAPLTSRPTIATGHQPELYHPGVLVKNFATAALARRVGGVGFNLSVDSDVAKTTGLTLPVSGGDHFDEVLHFSGSIPPLPYEEWACDDEDAFARLPELARPITRTWPWRPVLDSFWKQARDAAGRTRLIPERWLLARHHLECSWGIVNHELPMSRLCTTGFVGLLVGVFVDRRAEFAAVYNEELTKYRREQKIRSRNHPVAGLEVTAERIELPFWAWFPGTTQRGRLFARRHAAGVVFDVIFPEQEQTIPGVWPIESEAFHRRWPELRATRWKIRPKALITSMMLRLFVADLFLHGIGGAVYDELTDRIFCRFFGTQLPAFAVVTATLRLPWGVPPVREEDERRLRQSLRTLHWNPDRFLPRPVDGVARQYVELKRRLTHEPTVGPGLRERHHQFEEVREHLRPYVARQVRQTEAALHDTHRRHRRDDHRFSREHAWVLYPEDALREMHQRFDPA